MFIKQHLLISISLMHVTAYALSTVVPLEVEQIVKTPSAEHVSKECIKHKITPSLKTVEEIQNLVSAILSGTIYSATQSVESINRHSATKALYKARAFLAAANAQGLSSLAPRCGEQIISKLKNFIGSTLGSTLFAIADNCLHAYKSASAQKRTFEQEELSLRALPAFFIAHNIVLSKIVKLFFVLYSPKAHPEERIYALFAINKIQLAGNKQTILHDFLAKTNSYYFDDQGILKSYDPSVVNNHEPKRISALTSCLKKLASCQDQFLNHLKMGIQYGISSLQEKYAKASQKKWSAYKGLSSIKKTFLAVTRLETLSKRIDPVVINNNPANQLFMQCIMYCQEAKNPLLFNDACKKAQSLINEAPCYRSYMKKYLDHCCQRYTNDRSVGKYYAVSRQDSEEKIII